MGLSFGHLLLVLVIVLVLFGAGRLPQVMADVARGMRAFKKGLKEDDDSVVEEIIPMPKKIPHPTKKDTLSKSKNTQSKPVKRSKRNA